MRKWNKRKLAWQVNNVLLIILRIEESVGSGSFLICTHLKQLVRRENKFNYPITRFDQVWKISRNLQVPECFCTSCEKLLHV